MRVQTGLSTRRTRPVTPRAKPRRRRGGGYPACGPMRGGSPSSRRLLRRLRPPARAWPRCRVDPGGGQPTTRRTCRWRERWSTACTRPTRLSRGPAADHSAHPVQAVGPTARRPAPMSRWAAAEDSVPPHRSSRLAEVQVPSTRSVSSGWTAWPSQSPRNTAARAPVPNTLWIVGSTACTAGVERGRILESQGPAHDRRGSLDGIHLLSSALHGAGTSRPVGSTLPPGDGEGNRAGSWRIVTVPLASKSGYSSTANRTGSRLPSDSQRRCQVAPAWRSTPGRPARRRPARFA